MDPLKFLIIDTDYPDFLRWLYNKNKGLNCSSYEQQCQARRQSLFGIADFYSNNLKKIGHEAINIYANNVFMQNAWALEYNRELELPKDKYQKSKIFFNSLFPRFANLPMKLMNPMVKTFFNSSKFMQIWLYPILERQIMYYNPDVILNLSLVEINPKFLGSIKKKLCYLGNMLPLLCPNLWISVATI